MNTVFSRLKWNFHSDKKLPTRAYLSSTYGDWRFTIIEHPISDRELRGYDIYAVTGNIIRHEFFGTFETMTEGFDFFLFDCEEGVYSENHQGNSRRARRE